jgi:hypothetical protein
MVTPIPRFSVGDEVFVATVTTTEKHVECPDCLGSRKWTVSTPAGETFEVDCQTCRHGYEVRGFLVVSELTPVVYRTTIGSVRLDTHDERPVSYMVEATGVGTGQIWYEDDIFVLEALAWARAAEIAAERTVAIAEAAERSRRGNRDRFYAPDRWRRHRDALIEVATEAVAEQPDLRRRVEKLVKWIAKEKL